MQGGPDVTVAFDVGYRPGLADERVVVAIVDLAANLNDVGIACAMALGQNNRSGPRETSLYGSRRRGGKVPSW